MSGGELWRVGQRGSPLAFTPRALCEWNHRFDDAEHEFRTLYFAAEQRTSLREVLADFRPKAEAIDAFVAAFGPAAIADLSVPVTSSWRRQHVLVRAEAELNGPLLDLTAPAMRAELELRHAALLGRHGMEHLDLHEITSRRREVTQAIAADTFRTDRAAGLRFSSRLDGRPAFALFEGRAELAAIGDPVELTDPPPPGLAEVCTEWDLELEPA